MELSTLASAIPKIILLSSYAFFLSKDFATAFFVIFCTVLIGYLYNHVKEADDAAKQALEDGLNAAEAEQKLRNINFVGSIFRGLIVSLFISLAVLAISFHFEIGLYPTIIVALAASSRPKLIEETLSRLLTKFTKET